MLKLPVRVVDADGKPMANAKVTPWALRSSQGHGPWDENDKLPRASDRRRSLRARTEPPWSSIRNIAMCRSRLAP